MAYSVVPLESAVAGQRHVLENIAASFATPAQTFNTFVFINATLNALIGLVITLGVLAFLVHVFRWLISAERSELRRESIRGATRSLVALFLMVNVWSIFRTFDALLNLSDIAAFTVFFTAFVLFAFWSLFSLGDGMVQIISFTFEKIVDNLEEAVRTLVRRTKRGRKLMLKVSKPFLKVTIVALIFLFSLPIAFMAPGRAASDNAAADAAWRSLDSYATNGEYLDGSQYVNASHGVSVTLPEDWQTAIDHSSFGQLLESQNGSTTVRLYGYQYVDPQNPDILPADQFFAFTNNIANSYTHRGWAITRYDISAYGDIGSSSVSYIVRVGAQDPNDPRGGVLATNLLFGANNELYDLVINVPIDGADNTTRIENASHAFDDIARSITFNPPLQ